MWAVAAPLLIIIALRVAGPTHVAFRFAVIGSVVALECTLAASTNDRTAWALCGQQLVFIAFFG